MNKTRKLLGQQCIRAYSTILHSHNAVNPTTTIPHQQQIPHYSEGTPISAHHQIPKQINKSGRIWGWDKSKQVVDSMIRVDQAGEFGAVVICQGQRVVLPNDLTISEIQREEENHLRVMENLIHERRVRPTIMSPFWHVAGLGLGVSTALLGRSAAMACHKAVEDVISQHYNDQIREIYQESTPEVDVDDDIPVKTEGLSPEEKRQKETEYLFATPHQTNVKEQELRAVLKQFRDEELHHGEMAVENDAKSAPFYDGLYNVIKAACNTAIWVSKRI
jgi:ubiquinone biosynthesis monooxygenase Coq7